MVNLVESPHAEGKVEGWEMVVEMVVMRCEGLVGVYFPVGEFEMIAWMLFVFLVGGIVVFSPLLLFFWVEVRSRLGEFMVVFENWIMEEFER